MLSIVAPEDQNTPLNVVGRLSRTGCREVLQSKRGCSTGCLPAVARVASLLIGRVVSAIQVAGGRIKKCVLR
ncbi:hypothetical protein WJX73_010511 [Symbiochloris irregularis]|uniref:Uncharacterized protein n=1 Tax=Symbiochloris irregularis TaxID=706552 RepID=A0AAW1PB93_9CHLO